MEKLKLPHGGNSIDSSAVTSPIGLSSLWPQSLQINPPRVGRWWLGDSHICFIAAGSPLHLLVFLSFNKSFKRICQWQVTRTMLCPPLAWWQLALLGIQPIVQKLMSEEVDNKEMKRANPPPALVWGRGQGSMRSTLTFSSWVSRICQMWQLILIFSHFGSNLGFDIVTKV